jgi:hypothetical protein
LSFNQKSDQIFIKNGRQKNDKKQDFLKKSEIFAKKWKKLILLKKKPAENACAFAQGGVYTHLSKFIEIMRFFDFFQAVYSGTVRSIFPTFFAPFWKRAKRGILLTHCYKK